MWIKTKTYTANSLVVRITALISHSIFGQILQPTFLHLHQHCARIGHVTKSGREQNNVISGQKQKLLCTLDPNNKQ